MNLDDVLARLANVKRTGGQWSARCPVHDDQRNSLGVAEADDGKVLLHCYAGCSYQAIRDALGIHTGTDSQRIIATYDYRDEQGGLLCQAVRFAPKDFRQRKPDGAGGWTWSVKGVRRVPYRLPELLDSAADGTPASVIVVEGEKDADRLADLGFVATTNIGGAGKWRDEYAEHLRGRHAVVLPDNDEPGQKHAEQVARSLYPVAASLKIVNLPALPPKGDVSDWLDAGGTSEALLALIEAVPFPDSRFAISVNRENREKKESRFIFTALDDLLAEPEEQVAWVWERTLPRGGFSICAAKPKVGKSTLARNLAVAVARGDEFFGRATHKGAVLYLCLEEKRAEVAAHFRRMGAAGCDIHIHTGSAPEGALTLLGEAVEKTNPALVIIDPLSRFVRVTDFNDYAGVTRGLEPLIDLARSSGCHIQAVHHNGKGERAEGGDALLGSTGFFGAVDTLLTMKRREGGRTLETTQRYGDDLPETAVRLDPETGVVTAGGDVATMQLAEVKGQVLDCVGDDTLTEADIRERVGGNQRLVAKAIRALVEEGALRRTGAGRRGDPFQYHRQNTAEESDEADSSGSRFSRFSRLTDIANRESRDGREQAGVQVEDVYIPVGMSDEEYERQFFQVQS